MPDLASPHDGHVTANGLQLHYREWGNASAPALVLVHGSGHNTYTWDTFAPAMADRFRVLALDLRGHGESEHAADYHALCYAEDLAAFGAAMGLSQFAVLGLSLGGRTGYLCAGLHPDRVTRLVVVDAVPESAPAGLQRLGAAFASVPTSVASVDEMVEAMSIYFHQARPEELRRVTQHMLTTGEDGRLVLKGDRGVVAAPRMDAAEQWALIHRITCPTLLVRGSESDLTTREVAERFVSVLPHGQLVEVPAAGHPVPMDNPEGFLAAVRPFLLAEQS